MYFVAGTHGVGKTIYCKIIQKMMDIPHFTASEVIRSVKEEGFDKQKRVGNIDANQQILLHGLKNIEHRYKNYILDGHICLINTEKKIVPIDLEVFKEMNMEKLVIVVADPKIIAQRLKQRDHVTWDIQLIKQLQVAEIAYGRRIASALKIDMEIVDNSGETIKKKEKNNIILPIKPVYAEKILSGQKKYEYRKKLCQEDIDKIYIYATAPIKRLVGEVTVEKKVSLRKEDLWNESWKESGIEYEFYKEYFKANDFASAYKLGDYKMYKSGIPLAEIGIDYSPQSHVYIEKLDIE